LIISEEYMSMPRAKTAKAPKNGNARNMPALQVMATPNGSSVGDLEEQIRQRAYELYEERGCTPGHEYEDWLVAERQVLAKQAKHAVSGA
jgi:hypothetical protein